MLALFDESGARLRLYASTCVDVPEDIETCDSRIGGPLDRAGRRSITLTDRANTLLLRHDPSASDLPTLERQTITRVLQQAQGNKSAAARRLGLTRTQWYGRLRKFGT